MWTALILTILFGGMFVGISIWTIADNYNPSEPIREQEYRQKIEKEPFDSMTYWGEYYSKEMSEEQKKRYIKYCNKTKKQGKIKKKLFICLPIVIYIFAIFGFGFLGDFLENENLAREVEKYKANKFTIETSLQNNNLTGFERIDLVNQASDKNAWLAEKKYEIKQWYNFYLNKDIIIELELIDLYKVE